MQQQQVTEKRYRAEDEYDHHPDVTASASKRNKEAVRGLGQELHQFDHQSLLLHQQQQQCGEDMVMDQEEDGLDHVSLCWEEAEMQANVVQAVEAAHGYHYHYDNAPTAGCSISSSVASSAPPTPRDSILFPYADPQQQQQQHIQPAAPRQFIRFDSSSCSMPSYPSESNPTAFAHLVQQPAGSASYFGIEATKQPPAVHSALLAQYAYPHGMQNGETGQGDVVVNGTMMSSFGTGGAWQHQHEGAGYMS